MNPFVIINLVKILDIFFDSLKESALTYDKEYSKERQEIRKYIFKDNPQVKLGHPNYQIDWSYLLNAADG